MAYLLNLFLVSNRVPARPTAPASQRDRGDHKIDELTRQVLLNYIYDKLHSLINL